MNSTFLKVLPVAAALLLAVSCGEDAQDDSGVVVNPEPETANVVNTIPTAPDNLTPATPVDDEEGEPFTLKVVADNSLSKLSYNDDGTTVYIKFDTDDLGCEMSVYDDSKTHSTTMTLQSIDASGNGIFNGNWGKNGAPAEGTELNATIAYNNGSNIMVSTSSVVNLMENCPHQYRGTFRYITDNCVSLDDNMAYLEFTLSAEQKQVFVNDNWYDVNQETHKTWVAVDASNPVKTRIKGSKTLIPGYIYPLTCTDYVDLGQTVDGKVILWKTENETTEIDGGTHSFEYEGNDYAIYRYRVYETFGTSVNVTTDRLPSGNEYDALDDLFLYYKNTPGERGAWFGNSYGSLFLPACGRGREEVEIGVGSTYIGDYDQGTMGFYWMIHDGTNWNDDGDPTGAYIDFTIEENNTSKAAKKALKRYQPQGNEGGGMFYEVPYYSVRLVRGL